MQSILTQAIELFVIISLAMLVTDFVCSVPRTPQVSLIVECEKVEEVAAISYATLDWIQEPTLQETHDYWLECEIESESTDVIELAKAKAKIPTRSLLNATIRELKKLASERKLKGYSNMRKAELIAALS